MKARRRAALHSDFLAAPVSRRWRGRSLRQLWQFLNARVDGVDPGVWVGCVLPDGAHVALRRLEHGRAAMLYRREAPKTPSGPELWKAEVRVFARLFGIEGWDWSYGIDERGWPRAVGREPWRLV